jgi:hypothetical protein
MVVIRTLFFNMKRFTETTKWDDPWFMDLPLKYKLFWLYICDKCDNAGAWQPNIRLAVAQIGEPLELAEILRVFTDRIAQLGDGKLFITKFIPFQYGNLSPNCRAHIPILNNIEKLRVSKGYPKGIQTLMEKEKEKEKEKEGDIKGKENPSLIRARALFNKRLSTPLDDSERRAWSKAQKAIEATNEDEWRLLEWVYQQKGNDIAKYRRHDMATLFNNWNGAIDKAREWKTSQGEGCYPKDWSQSKIREYEEAQKKYG